MNFLRVILIVLLVFSCGNSTTEKVNKITKSQIVNGELVSQGELESVALLTGQHSNCSANLIESDVVLTAAHCIFSFGDLLTDTNKRLAIALYIYREVHNKISDDYKNLNDNELLRDLYYGDLKPNEKNLLLSELKVILKGIATTKKIIFSKKNTSFTVVDLKIHPDYVTFLFNVLFKETKLVDANDNSLSYDDSFDIATAKLETPVGGILPVPIIDNEDYRKLYKKGSVVKVVGYGRTLSQRKMEIFQRSIESYNQGIFNHMTDSMKFDALNMEIWTEKHDKTFISQNDLDKHIQENDKVFVSMYENFLKYRLENSSSNKRSIELKADTINELSSTVISLDSNQRAVCDGDSGGPVFLKISDTGEMRQIGVNTTGDCEKVSTFSSVLNLEALN